MIQSAKAHFENAHPSRESTYLKPYKRLLVDITTSQAFLDSALGFTNELFNALEAAGYRVMLAPANEGLYGKGVDEREKRTKERSYYQPYRIWSPDRPTVVYVGSVAIGLSIVEMSMANMYRPKRRGISWTERGRRHENCPPDACALSPIPPIDALIG